MMGGERMFLGELTQSEKECFWKLANCMIHADGIVLEDEVNMLEQYKSEMNLNHVEQINLGEDISSILQCCDEYIPKVKKIIMFELIGLAYADYNLANREADMLERIRDSFDISLDDYNSMKECVNEITNIYSKIGVIMNG